MFDVRVQKNYVGPTLTTSDRRDIGKQQSPTIQRSYKKKEMLPTIHQRTQVDDGCEYPASDSYTILLVRMMYKTTRKRVRKITCPLMTSVRQVHISFVAAVTSEYLRCLLYTSPSPRD